MKPSPDEPDCRAGPAAPEKGDGSIPELPPVAEEVDLWWGSCSSRALLPSLGLALVATGCSAWLSWLLLPHPWSRVVFFCLAASIFLCQGVHWAYYYFTFCYRLTTCRLFIHRGLLYFPEDQIELVRLAQVVMRRNRWERLVGVGQVLVIPEDAGRKPFVLKGIRRPKQVAEMIRVQVQKIRGAGRPE